ncbi:MAG: GNAT family N-acetyltransferase [Spirochaetota bacterium]
MVISLSSIIPVISFLLYIIFAGFGLSNARKEKVHWPFIFYMLLMSTWSFGSFMMHANTGIETPLFWNRCMMVGMLGVPIAIFHSVLNLFENRTHKYIYFIYVGYVIYGFLLYHNFTGHIVSNAWFVGDQFYYKLAGNAYLAYILSYLFLIFGIVALLRELYNARGEIVKKKLRLPLWGGIVMLAGVLFNLYEPIGRYPIDLFASTINAFIIFYAIYKYRLVHYSAFVIRAILYLVLVIVSALAFYGISWLSSSVIRKMPFEYSFLLALLLGAAAAVIFQPLRTGTLSVIEKLYFGKRLDYYKSLRYFSDSLKTIVELELLGESTVQKLNDTFDLEWSAILALDYTSRNYKLLAQSGLGLSEVPENYFVDRNIPVVREIARENAPIFGSGIFKSLVLYSRNHSRNLQPALILPLKFKDKMNGMVLLGKCRDKEFYDQFDIEILEILAGQCSVAMENAISFEKLKGQRKRLQNMNKELILSRNKLEAFFDGITTPISIQDINYNIVAVNLAATRCFRRPYRELLGRKCYQVFFGMNKPCDNCMAQDCLHAQLPFGSEKTDQRTKMIFSIHFYPISVPEGEKKIFLEFFQDVTQQKRLQEELVQSEKLAGIGTLASGIAHEINNPLYGIIGTAEIMHDELSRDPQLKEYTRDIINYAQNAAEIIKDLTNYTRREEKKTMLLDIKELIETSLKLAGRGLKFDNITVKKFYEEDLPLIEANPNELQQVFLNLVINAVQAMQGRGQLTISTEKTDGNVTIRVSDTGLGIEKKELEDIFNPFFTTKEPGKGTGLGLSIVHQIIYNMGGRVNVKSETGKGTTFYIHLPLTKEEKHRIRFVHARSEKELEDVFFLQRKILVGEKGYLEETIRRKVDEKAYHILAYKGLQPVGTVSCVTDRMVPALPVEGHFNLKNLRQTKRCVEIDRLAVLREERRGVIPLGLMTLAYLFARSEKVERIFLDVFSDEKKHINMYSKLGFQIIGTYDWHLPVTVMMMDYQTEYEKKSQRMEKFVKPFMTRLTQRIDYEEGEKQRIMETVESIISSSTPSK